MEKTQASKIELIVGDAISIMMQSGVSSEVIGPFAVKFPAKVAQRLATPEPETQPPQDIQALIDKAVKAEVARIMGASAQLRSLVQNSSAKVKVKVGPAQAKTSVLLPKILVDQAAQQMGSIRRGNELIRQIDEQRPADVANRSRWLTEELTKALSAKGQ